MAKKNSSKVESNVHLYEEIDRKKCRFVADTKEGSNPDYSTMSMTTMNTENIYTEAPATSTKSSNKKEVQKGKKLMYLLVISLSVITLMLIFSCIAALFVEVANLKSKTTPFQQTPPSEQASCSTIMLHVQQINQSLASQNGNIQQLNASIDMINQQQLNKTEVIWDSLREVSSYFNESLAASQNGNIQQLNASIDMINQQQLNTTEVIWDALREVSSYFNESLASQNGNFQQLNTSIDMINQQLLNKTEVILREVSSYLNAAVSCAALPPSSPSGYYSIRASNGSAVSVYCDMTRSCGGVTGGWIRVAELDMTDSSQECPSGFMNRTDSNISTCVKNEPLSGCSPILYSTANIQYSRICGRIRAYQVGNTNAFNTYSRPDNPNIDDNYVDGVSLTHGRNPRQHIWTFAATYDEANTHALSNCPCTNNLPSSGTPHPAFVGEDYFCDTGIRRYQGSIFYGDDPLWDGAGCGPQSTCCSFNTPPWFYKQLPQPTTGDIEMRVCRDQDAGNEDIAIESVEIYVQ